MISQNRLVDTFISLVKIDSPSGHEKTIAAFTAGKLKKLGANVYIDNYGNVIGKFAGVGEPMMLNAHLDTVEPGRNIQPILEGKKIITDGSTVLGGDAKAGVAAIFEALTSLKEEKKEHVPLDVVLTLSEEIGLLGAVNLNYAYVDAKRGVTFDGDGGVNTITISAPGYTRVDLTITGRAAHAGIEPEKGISAIKIAADIITKLDLGRIDHETTANVGLIQGGSARNAIPETAHVKGEIRSINIEKLNKHTLHFENAIKKAVKQHPKAIITTDMHRQFNPYILEENHTMIDHAKRIIESIGLKARIDKSGGGTDVNIFHSKGIEAICVGIGNYEAHTTREYVVIKEMLETAQFCKKLVIQN